MSKKPKLYNPIYAKILALILSGTDCRYDIKNVIKPDISTSKFSTIYTGYLTKIGFIDWNRAKGRTYQYFINYPGIMKFYFEHYFKDDYAKLKETKEDINLVFENSFFKELFKHYLTTELVENKKEISLMELFENYLLLTEFEEKFYRLQYAAEQDGIPDKIKLDFETKAAPKLLEKYGEFTPEKLSQICSSKKNIKAFVNCFNGTVFMNIASLGAKSLRKSGIINKNDEPGQKAKEYLTMNYFYIFQRAYLQNKKERVF